MLSSFDELMCHQLPATMDHIHTDNPEWTERIYVSIYNVRDKDTMLGFGVGQYPNKNVQDGFATIWHRGKQYNFRASRTLRPKIDEVKIGPLSVELLEGLKRFRLRLGENPSGMELDIEWIAAMNPHEEATTSRERRQGGTGYLALRPGGAGARQYTFWRQDDYAEGTHGGAIAIARGGRGGRYALTLRPRRGPLSRRFSLAGRWRSFTTTHCIGALSSGDPASTVISAVKGYSIRCARRRGMASGTYRTGVQVGRVRTDSDTQRRRHSTIFQEWRYAAGIVCDA